MIGNKVRVKVTLFSDERPSDMNEFASAGAQSDFERFASSDKAVIKGFDGRITSMGRKGPYRGQRVGAYDRHGR